MKKLSLLLLGCTILSPLTGFAQQQAPASGMRHMSVTADKPVAKSETTTSDTIKTAPVEKTSPKALKPQDALKKMEGLSEWPYYADLMTINNDTALEKVIRAVDIDPGSVPPKGLLYIAKALSERKRYEEAAFYFYAGQLRATFDMARFPPYELNDTKKAVDKRTEDQRGQVPEAQAVLINPHEPLSILALSIGSPVAKWAMADSARLDNVMTKVREWDLATPYAYLPDYDISHAAPFETWPQLLTKTRNDYFTRVRQISQGLNSVRPVDPTPNFSRP